MNPKRIGIWIIGARGSVASLTIAGLAAFRRGLSPTTGLVTCLPPFEGVDLLGWDNLVIGGHEIRQGTLKEELWGLHLNDRLLSAALLEAIDADLAEADAQIRPGVLYRPDEAIRQLAPEAQESPTPMAAVEQVRTDLADFRERNDLAEVVVVNLSSTEPTPEEAPWWNDLSALQKELESPQTEIPVSLLYAYATLDLGMPYVNFTPCLGASSPAMDELAKQRNTCHAGRDGKTGETVMKTHLAGLFLDRNFEITSWVGHNIFGNRDGQILDHPSNKASKIRGKDRVLASVLGYSPKSHVSIEYIPGLGDWKTAWDHIHFLGFLGTPMTMQFTWQGCDSALAAPLVIDLVRLTALARARGEVGTLSHLGSFFKTPLGESPHRFDEQMADLFRWVAADRQSG